MKTKSRQQSWSTASNQEVVPPRPKLAKNKHIMAINHDFAAFWHSESTIATMQMSASLSLDLEISMDGDDRSCSSLSSLSSYGSWLAHPVSSIMIIIRKKCSVGDIAQSSSRLEVVQTDTRRRNINCTGNQKEMLVIGDQKNQLTSFNRYRRKAKQIIQHICIKQG
jgi:hypothetical protein